MNPLEIVRGTRLDGLSREDRERAVRAFARLEARLAQLELIAKLARKAVDLDGSPFDHAGHCLTLQLALVDLDNHPDTRTEPS